MSQGDWTCTQLFHFKMSRMTENLVRHLNSPGGIQGEAPLPPGGGGRNIHHSGVVSQDSASGRVAALVVVVVCWGQEAAAELEEQLES